MSSRASYGGCESPNVSFPDVSVAILESSVDLLRDVRALAPHQWPETLAQQEEALYGFGPALYAFLLARGIHPGNGAQLIRYGADVEGVYKSGQRTYFWAGRYLVLEQASFGLLDDKPDEPERNTCSLMVPIASPHIRAPGVLTSAHVVEDGIKEDIGVLNYPDDPFTQRAFYRVAHAVAGAVITAVETNPPITLDRMPPWPDVLPTSDM